MQISNNYSTQNFKGLNYSNVYDDGLKLVKKELPQLKELGKQYDIKLSTRVDPICDAEYIEVSVNHLNQKPSLLKRLLRPWGFGKGWADCQIDCESLVDTVKKAISTLK